MMRASRSPRVPSRKSFDVSSADSDSSSDWDSSSDDGDDVSKWVARGQSWDAHSLSTLSLGFADC